MLRQVLVLAALLAAVHGAAPKTNAVSLGSTQTIAVQVAGCCFFSKESSSLLPAGQAIPPPLYPHVP
jgi:hypothetical protein